MDAAAAGVAAEIDQEEMLLVALRQRCDAGVVGHAGRPVGDVTARRHHVGGLLVVRQAPDLLGVPRAQPHRVVHLLVAQPPAAVAALDDVHPARRVAAVGVVVAGEQVAVLVEGQLLRVAQADGHDLQLRAVGVAAQHRAGVGVGEDLARGLDVEAAVADGEVDAAVGAHFQAVAVVAQVRRVDAVAVVQRLLVVGLAGALGVLQEPQVGDAGVPDLAVAGEQAGADAGLRGVEAVGEDGGPVRDAVAVGVLQLPEARR